MKLDIIQEFQVHPLFRKLIQLTPTIKGYLHILHFLFFFLPSRLSLVKVVVRMESKTVESVLDLRDMYQLDIMVKNKNDLVIPCILSSLIKEKSVVFDIGANCGWYSRVLGALNPGQATILAFEPNRSAFFYLAKNSTPNFFPLPLAVSDEAGIVLAGRQGPLRLSSGTVYQKRSQREAYAFHRRDVCSTTIDAVVEALGLKPSYLKIDVEGSELKVLQGAAKSLSTVKAIFVEINYPKNVEDERKKDQIFGLLGKNKFHHAYLISVQNKTIELIEPNEKPVGDILFTKNPVSWA